MSVQQVGDLQVGQDLKFQERQWRFERIGSAMMGLIVLAGLAGLFGGGPFSAATAGGENAPLEVQYGRFVRHGGPTELNIRVQPAAVQEDEARIWLDSEYLDGIEIESIVPEPDRVEAGADRKIFVFKLEQPGQPATIHFELMPDDNGVRTARVGLGDLGVIRFRQFVYP